MTLVRFYVEKEGNVVAAFPKCPYNDTPGMVICYSHVGQHSGGTKAYFRSLKRATAEQYASLKKELESIGYTLLVG